MAKLRVEDVAAAQPDERSKRAKIDRIRGLVQARIIPAGDLQRTGRRGRPAMLFDQSAPAACAVLFALQDRFGIDDPAVLSQCWRFLTIPHNEGEHAPVDYILSEIAQGRAAWLVLTHWQRARDGDVKTTAALRFEDDTARPIVAPSNDHEVIADVVLNFAPILERFTDAWAPAEPVH